MSQDLTPDDEALLAALAILEEDPRLPPGPHAGGLSEAADTLVRLYREAIGLIPAALPPMAPSPRVKRRLMEAISAAPATAGSPEAPVPETPEILAPPAPAAGDAAAGAARPLPFPRAAGAGEPARGGLWLGLAAALVLVLLGVSGYLYRGLAQRDELLARLNSERAAALQRVAEAEERLARSETQTRSMRDSFAVVTSPAVEVCTLRPSSPMPEVAAAHGVLFVAADHQHWYMSLRGLQPAGAGKVYQLWFVGAQGPVSAGTWSGGDASPGAPWQLGSEHMPPGTSEVRVTIEDAGGSARPRGPEVLRNADVLRTL